MELLWLLLLLLSFFSSWSFFFFFFFFALVGFSTPVLVDAAKVALTCICVNTLLDVDI